MQKAARDVRQSHRQPGNRSRAPGTPLRCGSTRSPRYDRLGSSIRTTSRPQRASRQSEC